MMSLETKSATAQSFGYSFIYFDISFVKVWEPEGGETRRLNRTCIVSDKRYAVRPGIITNDGQ